MNELKNNLPLNILKVLKNPTLYGFRYRDSSYVGNSIEIVRPNPYLIYVVNVKLYNKMHRIEGISLDMLYEKSIGELHFNAVEIIL